MIKRIRRSRFKNIFMDFEKEEEWLNKLCADGYSLKKISNGYYIFEECRPYEYIYRIEFIKNEFSNKDKLSYLNFIQEVNVDFISSTGRWYYFRRKSSLGQFDIYSDVDSKISHYKQINFIWYMLSFIFIISGISQDTAIISGLFSDNLSIFNILLGLILILLGVGFLILALPLKKKIAKLLEEKRLHE